MFSSPSHITRTVQQVCGENTAKKTLAWFETRKGHGRYGGFGMDDIEIDRLIGIVDGKSLYDGKFPLSIVLASRRTQPIAASNMANMPSCARPPSSCSFVGVPLSHIR